MFKTCFLSEELFVHFYIIMFLSNTNAHIVEVYYDLSEYGSVQETTNYATVSDNAIKFNDVKEWFDNNAKTKHQSLGHYYCCSEWAASTIKPRVAFLNHLPHQSCEMARLCIDAFTQCCAIGLNTPNNESELAQGFY